MDFLRRLARRQSIDFVKDAQEFNRSSDLKVAPLSFEKAQAKVQEALHDHPQTRQLIVREFSQLPNGGFRFSVSERLSKLELVKSQREQAIGRRENRVTGRTSRLSV